MKGLGWLPMFSFFTYLLSYWRLAACSYRMPCWEKRQAGTCIPEIHLFGKECPDSHQHILIYRPFNFLQIEIGFNNHTRVIWKRGKVKDRFVHFDNASHELLGSSTQWLPLKSSWNRANVPSIQRTSRFFCFLYFCWIDFLSQVKWFEIFNFDWTAVVVQTTSSRSSSSFFW